MDWFKRVNSLVQSLSGWGWLGTAVLTAFYALLAILSPIFDGLHWTEVVLLSILMALGTLLAISLVAVISASAYRKFRPIPASEIAEELDRTKERLRRAEERLDGATVSAAIGNTSGRGAAGPSEPQPDITLKDLAERIAASSGELDSARKINLEVGDKVRLKGLTVWARYADFPLQRLGDLEMRHAIFDVGKGQVSIPNQWRTNTYTDVQFVKAEIDGLWPAAEAESPPKDGAKAGADGAILKPAPSKSEDEKPPPLKVAERPHCRAAIVDVRNYLNGDLTTLHHELVNARNSEKMGELKRYARAYQIKAANAEEAIRGLLQKHWAYLNRMGSTDLKPLQEALGDLKGKIGMVKRGVDLNWPPEAITDAVIPMHEKNLEIGHLGRALIEEMDRMEAEFFGD